MNWKLFLLPLVLCVSHAVAQSDDNTHDRKIESMRVQYISEKLDLSPEEAQQFWPIYNQYRKELDQVKSRRLDKLLKSDQRKQIEDMSEAEARQLIENELQREREFVHVRETYYQQLKKVIPVKKIASLYKAEMDFHKKLIHQLSENCEDRRAVKTKSR